MEKSTISHTLIQLKFDQDHNQIFIPGYVIFKHRGNQADIFYHWPKKKKKLF